MATGELRGNPQYRSMALVSRRRQRDIYELIILPRLIMGVPQIRIARELTADGVKLPRGGAWSPPRLNILIREVRRLSWRSNRPTRRAMLAG